MVDAALPLPGDPALPVRQPKDQRSPIGDRRSDREFASAVALGKDRLQVEPQDAGLAIASETVVLDPEMDPEAVAEAVAEAVVAFVAAGPAMSQEPEPLPRDAVAIVNGLDTLSTAQLQTALPEPVGMQPTEVPPDARAPVPAGELPVRGPEANDTVPDVMTLPLPSQSSQPIRQDHSPASRKHVIATSAVPAEAPLVADQSALQPPVSVPVPARMVDEAGAVAAVPVAMPAGGAAFVQAAAQPPVSRPSPPSHERAAARMDASADLPQDAGAPATPDSMAVAAVAPQPAAGTGDSRPEHAGRETSQDADLPAGQNHQSTQPALSPQQQNQPAAPIPSAGYQPTALLMPLPGQASLPTLDQVRMVQVLRTEPQAGQPQRQLEIILAPPELGAVRVVITRDDGEMRIEMVASTSRAVEVLEQARESMVDSIRDTGMRPGPIEIRQDLNAPRNPAGEFAGNSTWHGRQEQARQQSGDTRSFLPDRAPASTGAAIGNSVRVRQGLIL